MPNQDVQRILSKLSNLPLGIDMGTDASLLQDSQASLAINLDFGGDLVTTRPPLASIPLDTVLTGRFQGAGFYDYSGLQAPMAMIDSHLYIFDLQADDTAQVRDVTPTTGGYPYPTTLEFVHLFQAEPYMIVLGYQQKPMIFDGANTRFAGPQEVPSGVLGTYAWGRIWVALNDRRSFVAGDIVYGPSGTPAQNFIDAILKFTENDFLNEGGLFGVPNNAGPITSMLALATIDTSLGIGPLLIGTANSVVSVNAPTDRTTWKNLTYPIQTISLIDYGPLGPRSTIPINNDMWYRSIDGIRSFLIGRRSTNSTALGNTPQSHEISPVLFADTQALLGFSSAVLFGNKARFTVAPRATDQGVVHDGQAVMNFDSLSTINLKQPPIWEGFNSGLPIFQLVKGRINGTERAFAFALNETAGTVELWELLPTGYYDTYRAISGGDTTIVRTPIATQLESKRFEYERLVKLIMAELYLDDIVDDITLTIKFRPDEYPDWVTWATIRLCASISQCTLTSTDQFSCTIFKPNARTYAVRIRLPRPPEDCNVIVGMPLDRGYAFQFRFEGLGHFRLRKFRPHLRIQPDATEGECPTQQECITFPHCDLPLFDYQIERGPTVAAPVLDLSIASTPGNTILEWEQESTPDTNEVWRSKNGGAFSLLATLTGALTTYTDTDAMGAGDVWCYKVRSILVGTTSAFSNEGCALKDHFFLDTGAVSQPTWILAYGDFGADDPGAVTSLDLSGLKRVYGGLFIDTMSSLTTVNLDSLVSVGGIFLFSTSTMALISLPVFTTLGGTITANTCPNLTTFSAPLWATASADLQLDNNVLTSISIPSLVLGNGQTYAFDNNALSAASVELILARAVASTVTTASIFLNGGTNAGLASLSVQGQTDYAALITAGNTVNINA